MESTCQRFWIGIGTINLSKNFLISNLTPFKLDIRVKKAKDSHQNKISKTDKFLTFNKIKKA